MYRCTVGDNLNIRGQLKWSVDELTWSDEGVDYPGVDFGQTMRYVADMFARYCRVQIRIVRQSANVVTRFGYIDGVDGVLAQAELPRRWPPGSGGHEQLEMLFDNSERRRRPTQTRTNLVGAHEFCHNVGVLHFNRLLSLMNSGLGGEHNKLHEEWDDWTIDELRSRYGAPRVQVPGCGWLGELCEALTCTT